jgi:Family of unknown function (DUF5317)
MVFLLVLGAAVAVGLALGGQLRAAAIRFRAVWLFFAAIALQLVAFPSGVLPWSTGDDAARVLWLASYGCLIAGALVNMRVRGVPIVAAGMLLNFAAIVANRGHMPALPDAAAATGLESGVHNNSVTDSEPALSWLVDRWAAPDWVPLANVYSVGDVVLALGAFVVVLGGMRVSTHIRHRPVFVSETAEVPNRTS